ncbi:MAG: hypothetical protein SVE93_07865 [Candidatus Thermoplasmatota archaeon]|nr:hypothetical protein [Candidatus Thermoplasmatota archaeon]
MRGLKLYGKEDLRLEEIPEPPCPEGGLLLRVEACAICGSDLRKPKQVAVVATAKKLLCIIYAMLTEGEEYREGDDLLAYRKMRRMKSAATSVIPGDMSRDLERLKSKVNIPGGGYAVK